MYHPAVQSAVTMVLHCLDAKTAPCSSWRGVGGLKKVGDFFISLNVDNTRKVKKLISFLTISAKSNHYHKLIW